ncbi:MAG: hypothetical protein KDD47_15185 [Acidobacteria bacterium]|nr:hypothetical protein [Acidobacteriota bacterium]
MTTTPLFVELLVIGFGALSWMLLAFAAALGYDPFGPQRGLLALAEPVVWLVPALTLAYVLGVVTDRFADRVFDRWDRKMLHAVFKGDRERYYELRRVLSLHGRDLWDNLEYGRSRMRICRGWALNFFLLALSTSLFLVSGAPAEAPSARELTVFNLGFLLLSAGCVACWRKLNRKEYEKIQRQAEWLKGAALGKVKP